MKFAYLDFEFNGIAEKKLNLVSASVYCTDDRKETYVRNFWLLENLSGRKEARDFLRMLVMKGYIFVAYVMEAEARSLLSLFGMEGRWIVEHMRAIDLYLEYRCLLNHNHKLAYGEQYLGGKLIHTTPPPPKWKRDGLKKMGATPAAGEEPDDDEDFHHKPSYSLASAAFKLTGVKLDTTEKNEVRDIIIEGDRYKIFAARERIQAYNASDVRHLPAMLAKVCETFLSLLRKPPKPGSSEAFFEKYRRDQESDKKEWLSGALQRGNYAIRTARMLELGYPVNLDKVKAFTGNLTEILNVSVEAVLEAAPDVKAFRFGKKEKRWILNEKAVRDWVAAQKLPHWRETSGGKSGRQKLSISKDAFADWFDSQSPGFAGAFCRHLKTKQSLNGFVTSATSKRGVFMDFVGSDGRVRPNFGIYGSQASRSQPGAVGFIPLKAHWMRNFIEPPKGKALAGIDYASQEFLIAAILAQDSDMIRAYETGDVYLAFGKDSGIIPRTGTKESHKKERDLCKTVVLGISYDLSSKGLAPRLTRLSGRVWTEHEAQDLINVFYDTYGDYKNWKENVKEEYNQQGWLSLPDNWVMWGDNDNERSVGNFPVQGHGAVIMREAVARAQEKGLDVIFTLHDALYIEFKSDDVEPVRQLMRCMADAFEAVMSWDPVEKKKRKTSAIRLEGEMWSPDFREKSPPEIKNVLSLFEYIDNKGKDDLERYRRFLTATQPQGGNHGISESCGRADLLQIQGLHAAAAAGDGGSLCRPGAGEIRDSASLSPA